MTDITEQLLTFEPDKVSDEILLKMLSDAADEVWRLRVALAYYSDKDAYEDTERTLDCGCCFSWHSPEVMNDKGKVARIALGDEK